ncbi:MAG: hypothetical protein WAM77_13260 [Xanthobacteraceae bacterium]
MVTDYKRMSKWSAGMPRHSIPPINRRSFLIGAGAAGMATGAGLGAACTQAANAADYTLRIAPLRLELAPGKAINTFGYNGMVPGPVLRLREGRQVTVRRRGLGHPVASNKTRIIRGFTARLPSQPSITPLLVSIGFCWLNCRSDGGSDGGELWH